MTYAFVFLATFAFIGLKSWQQLNVVRRAYLWIVPTSMLMEAIEVFLIVNVVNLGFGWNVFWAGLGGGLGSALATWLHYKVMR